MPEYLYIIHKTINSAQDGHTSTLNHWLLDIVENNWIPNGLAPGIDSLSLKYTSRYIDFMKENFYTKLDLDLTYTSGEYYNILPFSYKREKFPAAMKLISCNNVNVHKQVKGMVELVSPMNWDRENNKVYYESFYNSPEIYQRDSLHLVFEDKESKRYNLNISKQDTVTFLQKKKTKFGYNSPTDSLLTTHYFNNERIFYARLPMMIEKYGDSLSNRLKSIINKHPVDAIVLDVRGNGGGSDRTYSNFLKKVLKDTLKVNLTLGRNFSPFYQKYLGVNKDTILKESHLTFNVENVATLKNSNMFYIVMPNYTYVTPDSITYPFDGPIYILQDRFIYSSTSNLSNLAKISDKLISIGETPNLLGGLQTNVVPLSLPNSKLIFRVEPQIDFTNTKTTADIFQNYVEYPVSYSIDFLYERTTTEKDVSGKEFLYEKDPMFRKAIELERIRKNN